VAVCRPFTLIVAGIAGEKADESDMDNPIKALIVDDALFMRKAISEILESDSDLQIVGTARDGLQCLWSS